MKGYPTLVEGIIFIETGIDQSVKVSKIETELRGVGAQLKNLGDVKRDLAHKAKSLGCNCVSEFKYGQKSRWIAIDDVYHFGSGIAVKLPEESFSSISAYIRERDA